MFIDHDLDQCPNSIRFVGSAGNALPQPPVVIGQVIGHGRFWEESGNRWEELGEGEGR